MIRYVSKPKNCLKPVEILRFTGSSSSVPLSTYLRAGILHLRFCVSKILEIRRLSQEGEH